MSLGTALLFLEIIPLSSGIVPNYHQVSTLHKLLSRIFLLSSVLVPVIISYRPVIISYRPVIIRYHDVIIRCHRVFVIIVSLSLVITRSSSGIVRITSIYIEESQIPINYSHLWSHFSYISYRYRSVLLIIIPKLIQSQRVQR